MEKQELNDILKDRRSTRRWVRRVIKNKGEKLYARQEDTRRLCKEYGLSIFAELRFLRVVSRTFNDGMETGYVEGKEDTYRLSEHKEGNGKQQKHGQD